MHEKTGAPREGLLSWERGQVLSAHPEKESHTRRI